MSNKKDDKEGIIRTELIDGIEAIDNSGIVNKNSDIKVISLEWSKYILYNDYYGNTLTMSLDTYNKIFRDFGKSYEERINAIKQQATEKLKEKNKTIKDLEKDKEILKKRPTQQAYDTLEQEKETLEGQLEQVKQYYSQVKVFYDNKEIAKKNKRMTGQVKAHILHKRAEGKTIRQIHREMKDVISYESIRLYVNKQESKGAERAERTGHK